ncbi:MAG TPA: hypothetical protein VGC45_15815 [Gryllotalpicola sp.]
MDPLKQLEQLFPGAPWLPWVGAVIAALGLIVLAGKLLRDVWQLARRSAAAVTKVAETSEALAELPAFTREGTAFFRKHGPMLDQLAVQILNDHGNVNLREELTAALDAARSADQRSGEAITRLERVERGVEGLYEQTDNLDSRLDNVEDTFRPTPPKGPDS